MVNTLCTVFDDCIVAQESPEFITGVAEKDCCSVVGSVIPYTDPL